MPIALINSELRDDEASQDNSKALKQAVGEIYSRKNLGLNVRTFTVNSTIDVSDALCLCDATLGAFTLTLVSANSWSSRQVSKTPLLIIQHISGVAGIIIAAAAGETINGAVSISMPPSSNWQLISDGNNKWYTFTMSLSSPLLTVPTVAIDLQYLPIPMTLAIETSMGLRNTTFTTLAPLQTAVNYLGSGLLSLVAIWERSAGALVLNASCRITIDGVVVFNSTTLLGTQSRFQTVVGNQFSSAINGDIFVTDGDPVIPFNTSCNIQYASDGVSSVLIGWKINKRT
jgi:hypothetical protein